MNLRPVMDKAVFFAMTRPALPPVDFDDLTPVEEEIIALRRLESLWGQYSSERREDYHGKFIDEGIDHRSEGYKELLELADRDPSTLSDDDNDRLYTLLMEGGTGVCLWSPLSMKRNHGMYYDVVGTDILEFIPHPAELKRSDASWWSQYTDSSVDICEANNIFRMLQGAGLEWREYPGRTRARGGDTKKASVFYNQYNFLVRYLEVVANDPRKIYSKETHIKKANKLHEEDGCEPYSKRQAEKIIQKLVSHSDE